MHVDLDSPSYARFLDLAERNEILHARLNAGRIFDELGKSAALSLMNRFVVIVGTADVGSVLLDRLTPFKL